ncbi:DUF397 domain-containing protein [Streptomyces chattanoogensis]|uniref:DUF397 domain-containing protein n=1 Tax=Streptomyces chattanoogensis TaxID=66876 RepID=UPI00369813A5
MSRVEIRWRKSSFSADPEGNCIELALHEGDVLVRESDEPGAVVKITPAKLRAFLASAKAGKFDGLT